MTGIELENKVRRIWASDNLTYHQKQFCQTVLDSHERMPWRYPTPKQALWIDLYFNKTGEGIGRKPMVHFDYEEQVL